MMSILENNCLNVVIVDDEIDACRNLQKILLEYVDPGIYISGFAHNTREAEIMINKFMPDLVFLDIEMPQENAFDFLGRISPLGFDVIFVTAYDEYAVKAFKLNAIDYILKPISISEVADAVAKAKSHVAYKKSISSYNAMGGIYKDMKSFMKLDKIRLKDNYGFDIVDFKDIIYVEAKGSYSNVCFLKEIESEKHVITSNSLNEYEELFPAGIFYRVHRSYLVNCMHVKKILAEDNSFVLMKNKAKLPVSRRRVTDLMDFFKKL